MIIESRLKLMDGNLTLNHAEILAERRKLFEAGYPTKDIQIRLQPPEGITLYGHPVID